MLRGPAARRGRYNSFVKRMLTALTLCMLTGCTGGNQEFTLLPYGKDDEVLEIIGKTIINVPVWTLEGVLGITVIAMYLAALAGYRRG